MCVNASVDDWMMDQLLSLHSEVCVLSLAALFVSVSLSLESVAHKCRNTAGSSHMLPLAGVTGDLFLSEQVITIKSLFVQKQLNSI